MADIKWRRLSPVPWIVLGALALLGGLGSVVAWAVLTEIHGAVIAQGTIAVEGKEKTVQHLEGGIVGEILVRDGDRVARGDVLLRLDDESLKANLAITIATLNELLAERARLRAERDGKAQIAFPASLVRQQDNLEIQRLLEGQRELFQARQLNRKVQKRILDQKIEALQQQIEGSRVQKKAKATQLAILEDEIATVSRLIENKLALQPRLLTLRRQAAEIRGTLGQLIAVISRLRSDIEEIRLQKQQIDKDFREEVLSRISAVRSKIVEFSERKTALQDKLKRIELRAPVAGRIHDMQIHTVDGVIPAGRTILRIIPDEDRLIIEARIRPLDRDQVHPGQEAMVNLVALDRQSTPLLMARVTKISPAALTDPNTGGRYYTLTLEIPDSELRKVPDGKNLVPGMPAEVFIRTYPRTPFHLLTKPLLDYMGKSFLEG